MLRHRYKDGWYGVYELGDAGYRLVGKFQLRNMTILYVSEMDRERLRGVLAAGKINMDLPLQLFETYLGAAGNRNWFAKFIGDASPFRHYPGLF